jgi:outer membrane immunogenic protein
VGVTSSFSCPVLDCAVENPKNLAHITAASSQSISAHGFTGGVQAGYNWQTGGLVLGIESDFDAFKLNGSRSEAVPSASSSSIFNPSTSIDTDWLFTLRADPRSS